MSNLFEELKRRNVVRVGIAYAVVGWLIIEVIDTIAPRMAMPEWVPGFFIIAVLVGFPLALFFSWAYELTPQGVKKTAEVDTDASITPSTGRKLDRVIIAALVVALGYFAWDKFGAEPEKATQTTALENPIIAVLPFVNMSSDAEQEYFSDGISEEILNVLARTEGLQVVSRTSSFAFKGTNRNVTEIAASLKANIVLEGSVRKGGERVRITAQLIDASTGLHLWSGTYDRELSDIFAVQDEISKNIASALLGAVGIEALPEKRFGGTADMTAYNTYLQANALLSRRTNEGITEATRLYELATRRDPEFANAWAGLAKARFLHMNRGIPLDDMAIEEAARRALELDPGNGQVLATQGLLKWNRLQFEEAQALLERAVVASPNDSDVRFWSGLTIMMTLNFEAAIRELEIARRLDPSNPNIVINLLLNYRFAGRDQDMLSLIKRVESGEEPVPTDTGQFILVRHLMDEGDLEAAETVFQEFYSPDEATAAEAIEYYILARLSGDPARLERAREMLLQGSLDQQIRPSVGIQAWLELGEPENARKALIKHLDSGIGVARFLIEMISFASPHVDSVSIDPRPVVASQAHFVEAFERAGILLFEGVEPYVPEGADNE